MKKISKLLSLILITLIITVTFGVNAAPKSTKISLDGTNMPSLVGENFNWDRLKTSEGFTAYCMDVNKKWNESGTTMTYEGEADAGIKYILENGYPNKKITGDDTKDRFITQAAIWWYQDELGKDFTEGIDPYGLLNTIKSLKDAAKNAKNEAETVSVDVSLSNLNMSLSSDKKEYVSSAIAPSIKGASSYTVTVTGLTGVTVTDVAGAAKTTFNAGEKFIVRFPSSSLEKTSTISVKVSATNKVKKAYTFKPADSSYQRITSLYEEEITADKTVSFTAKVNSKKVCVEYVIVGDVKPDPNLTDPTPSKVCYDKGTKYTQEKTLTTRQTSCKFKGWFTNSNLTGKWNDGTALQKDEILYGAWDCGSEIKVPATAANTPIVILAVGLIAIAGGLGVYYLRDKKLKANK